MVGTVVAMARYNVRDILGHYVAPRSARGDMCPHACCMNKRVHPSNYPAILPPRLLRKASDEDLEQHYRTHRNCPKCERQVIRELNRRDQADQLRKAAGARAYSRRMEREEAVEYAYVTAERETRGNMLNPRGRARGISDRSLFTGSEERARRYASEELLEHWQVHGRPTIGMFRGRDTRVQPKATEPRRKVRGVREVRKVRTVQAVRHRP